MIEVFKTNVNSQGNANMLADRLRKSFVAYTVHFDLEDCDRILRIESADGKVENQSVVQLLKDLGFEA